MMVSSSGIPIMRLRKPAISSLLLLLLLAVIAAFLARGLMHRGAYQAEPGSLTDPPSAFTGGRPNLVAAMFYSAWCSSCAVLDPKIRNVAPEFDGRAVQFVKFDFTMGPTSALAERAEELGVRDIYEQNKGATGFMALIDSRNEAVLSTVYMTDSETEIRNALNEAIRRASEPQNPTEAAEL